MYTLADLIVCCIISAGIGFFWAMWRTDNIKVKTENIIRLDAAEFWQRAEEWRSRQEKN